MLSAGGKAGACSHALSEPKRYWNNHGQPGIFSNYFKG